uniref:Uncharacterized protein n=1 Tax=Alexandrium catenella TaxID=2925 RepID=A0A7S1QWT3_ALECA
MQPALAREEEVHLQGNAQVFLGLLGVQSDPKRGVTAEISPKRVVEVLSALASQRDDEMQRVFSQLLSQRRGRGLVTEWWGDMAASLRETWAKRLAAV